jgi:hypothetical protein
MAGRGEDDAIRVAAYYIWEREGRPEGRALNHWARAVIEIHGGEPDRLIHSMRRRRCWPTYLRTCRRCSQKMFGVGEGKGEG